ncbi:hypothetical protein ACM64Y_03820 [Novispirillum sp. DQ9]|uniref:hypothetical protein n=1 Tax=Novispirillum sp. DQ9 TaxID=3398612 RepID=UPI003C7BAE25
MTARTFVLTPLILLGLAGAAAAQVGPEPADPLAREMWQQQKRLQKESERTFEALRRNDAYRQDLSDVSADSGASGVVLEGRARLERLDEAEVERLRAILRAERAAKEEEIRRQMRR